MGAGHGHGLAPDGSIEAPPRASERTTTVLSIIVGAVVFLTVAGAVAIWPNDWSMLRSVPTSYEGATWVEVTVEAVDPDTGEATVTLDGEERVLQDPGLSAFEYHVGDPVRALELDTGEIVFSDFQRGPPMLLLLVVYVALVLLVARWRGLGALLGLVGAFGVVVFFTIPALFDGSSPLIVGLVTGAGALFVLLYLAHGANARTTTAYLGTLAGLVITALLAWWAVGASHLMGIWSEDGAHLELAGRSVDLQGLVLCGIIIAGLGVLNDVTVTQSSAVWELRAARPDLSRWSLFARGMRIGRDHIASTVYTIAFAYVGAALPALMLVTLYDNPLLTTLTSADIAEEVVRTLVTSIGLVLAVPLTTGIAALVVGGDGAIAAATDHESPSAAGAGSDAEADPVAESRG